MLKNLQNLKSLCEANGKLISAINADLDAMASETEQYAIDERINTASKITKLLSNVKTELANRLGPKDSEKVIAIIKNKVRSLNNKAEFLQAVLKEINPYYGIKAKSNQIIPIQLSNKTFAQFLDLTPDEKVIAQALSDNIQNYKTLLDKVKKQTAINNLNTFTRYILYIEKHCSDYLEAVRQAGGELLYRGVSDTSYPVFIGRPRTNREPRDSVPSAQKFLDAYLSAMGFKALRRNSLFTTSDFSAAEFYGKVYAIFPKNGFKYTWSTKHNDLVLRSIWDVEREYVSLFRARQSYWPLLNDLNQYMPHRLSYSIVNEPEQFNLSYSNTDSDLLNQAKQLRLKIETLPEYEKFIIAFKNYTKINDEVDAGDNTKTTSEFYSAFIEVATAFLEFINKTGFKLLPDLQVLTNLVAHAKSNLAKIGNAPPLIEKASEIIKNMGFINTDLPAAIKSGHEVMIYGEYVAINYHKFRKELRTYFN